MANGALFTHDYLGEAILGSAPWQALDDDGVAAFREAVLAVYRAFPTARRPNEAVTEDDLIWKVLSHLGWRHALRQINLSLKGMDHKPDGLLFADEPAKERANARAEEWQRYADGVAIVESKRWLRELDRKSPYQDDLGVPSTQMIRYLDRVNIVTNGVVRWGILTNGRHWRLYYHGATSVAEEFLELDLPVVVGVPGIEPGLAGGDPVQTEMSANHQLKLFMVMFGPAAFRPGTDGRTFHQVARDDGRQWEQRVTGSLSDRVFDKVFPVLVQGIVAHDPEAPRPATPEYLDEVRDAALILLYRLLFVLCAEDRNLLPARHRAYEESGMRKPVREDIGKRIDRQDVFMAEGGDYYPHLLRLFRRIDQGAPAIGLPPCNGGLFAAGRYGARLLDRIELPDSLFAPLVDSLSRDDDGGRKKWINYRDLSVQHLGSIYERLLESEVTLTDGAVTVGDGAARHGSGSFYTPEAPVQLILHQAVGPMLGDRLAAFRRRAEELTSSSRTKADRLAELKRLDPATRMLEITVCDPAMGSGHFLVSLVDYLADRVLAAIAEVEATVTWTRYESPLVETIAGIRDGILARAREGKWTIEKEQLEDRLIVRRMILKRVIYGVDKNPMAVELAKLALWLHTFTVGAPLSFLEHHLRCGDSICGEWVLPVEENLKKIGAALFLGQSVARAREAAQGMAKIERLVDADVAEVRLSQDTFETVKEATEPLNRFLDFIQARRWIGAGVAAAQNACAEALAERNAILSPEKYVEAAFHGVLTGDYGDPIDIVMGAVTIPPGANGRTPDAYPKPSRGKAHDYIPAAIQDVARELVDEARRLAARERFLHWQVAFPGVWDDWESMVPRGGFDAVIGNPPYVRQELLSRAKPFLREAYATFDGAADLYVYFCELGLKILKPGGRLSFIVTNKWMKAGYAEALRTLFAEHAWIEALVDFGHARQFFPDADVFPCVLTLRKPLPEPEPAPVTTRVCVIDRDRLDLDRLIQQVDEASFAMPREALSPKSWNLEPPEVLALMEKIGNTGVKLKDYIGAKPYRGVTTGLNEAFLVDTTTREALIFADSRSVEIIKPYFRGQDIDRWYTRPDGMWMIFARRGIEIDQYPAIRRHLERFRTQLEPKPVDWDRNHQEEKWGGRKEGNYKWFEIQDSTDYWEYFGHTKIFYQEIQYHPCFAMDYDGIYGNNKTSFIPSSDLYLLGLLNSPLIWWHNWRYLPHMKDEALAPVGYKMEVLPIATPTDDIRSQVTEAVTRLITNARAVASTTESFRDWLRLEFEISKPGQRLQAPTALTLDEFLIEVRKSRKKRLSPAALADLRHGYAGAITPARALLADSAALERTVATLINRAYGLTPDEEALMWRTAPPRMPAGPPES